MHLSKCTSKITNADLFIVLKRQKHITTATSHVEVLLPSPLSNHLDLDIVSSWRLVQTRRSISRLLHGPCDQPAVHEVEKSTYSATYQHTQY